jgi:phosphohistidine phosphatase
MRVLVVRHGIAIDDAPGLGDEERYLTSEGRQKTRKVAEALKLHGVKLERILTSPLVRAVQTAEILARELGCPDVRVSMSLVLGSTMASIDAAIAGCSEVEGLALVGHEPTMSAVAAHLLGLRAFPRSFKKAGVCAIALPSAGATGRFEFFVVPKGPSIEKRLGES